MAVFSMSLKQTAHCARRFFSTGAGEQLGRRVHLEIGVSPLHCGSHLRCAWESHWNVFYVGLGPMSGESGVDLGYDLVTKIFLNSS